MATYETRTALEARVRELENALAASEQRYRSMFADMNVAYAEQDIREAKRMLDEAKARGATDFRALAASDPGLIDRCIGSITVTTVNEALLRLMGYADHDELVAKPPTENAEAAHAVMTQQLEAMFELRRHFTTTATLIGKDGRRVPVAVGVNVTADWTSSLSTHFDISAIQDAHESVLAMREELARANRVAAVGAFTASLAHELNQPITAVRIDVSTTARLLDRSPPDAASAREALARAAGGVARVQEIMTRTRERLVRGARAPEDVDLGALLQETAMLLVHELASRSATLTVVRPEGPMVLRSDRIGIQQVLVNLVVNAADAMMTEPGPRPVEARATASKGGGVVVEVLDRGPGIPEALRERIFEPLYSTKTGGMGMGLEICRSIAASLGGSLTVGDRVDGPGAVFTFVLPRE